MKSLPDQVEESMTRHEDEAPDGAYLAHLVLARVQGQHAAGPRNGPAKALGAAMLVAAVLGVVAIGAHALSPAPDVPGAATVDSDGGSRVDLTPGSASAASSPSTVPRPEAVLDPLSFELVLGSPGPEGSILSRIHVENDSGATIVDPGCRWGANYSYGVVPVDDPGAELHGHVITKCGGVQPLRDGFTGSTVGPVFDITGLAPGDYLATIDFGDARTRRLAVPITIG